MLGGAHSIRFIVVGLAMTALHLAVFALLSPWSVPEIANVGAFLVATQLNFAASYLWTWSARRPAAGETVGYVLRCAALFNGSAALGFGVNAVVFSTAHRLVGLPPLQSALAATVVSAATSFLLSSRLVFRGAVLARSPVLGPAGVLGDPGDGAGAFPLVISPTPEWERGTTSSIPTPLEHR